MNPTQLKVAKAHKQYHTSRAEFLLVLIFTLVNFFLLIFNTDTYFLFSLFSVNILSQTAFLYGMPALYAICAVIFAAFVACYIFSKKNFVLYIVGFALFCIDTIVMVFFCMLDSELFLQLSMDLIFHILLLVYFIMGIVAGINLKKYSPYGIETQPADIRTIGVPVNPNNMGGFTVGGFDPNAPQGTADNGVYNPYNGTQPEGYNPFDPSNLPENKKNESPFAEFENNGNNDNNGGQQ